MACADIPAVCRGDRGESKEFCGVTRVDAVGELAEGLDPSPRTGKHEGPVPTPYFQIRSTLFRRCCPPSKSIGLGRFIDLFAVLNADFVATSSGNWAENMLHAIDLTDRRADTFASVVFVGRH